LPLKVSGASWKCRIWMEQPRSWRVVEHRKGKCPQN
jgi:hypothetical protein